MIDDLGVPLPDVEEVEELATQAGKETVHPDPGKEVVSLHMYSATNVKPGEEVASLVALEMGRPPGKRRRVHEGAQAVHMPVHILEDLQLVDTGEEAVSLHTQSGGGAQCWPGEASVLAAVKHEVGLMHMHTASRPCAGASVLEDLQLVAPGEEVVSARAGWPC